MPKTHRHSIKVEETPVDATLLGRSSCAQGFLLDRGAAAPHGLPRQPSWRVVP